MSLCRAGSSKRKRCHFPVPLPCDRQPAARASSTNPNSRRRRSGGMSRVQYHRPLRERRSHERGTSTARVMTASMREPCRQATCSAAQLDFPSVANLDSDRIQPGPGRFVFLPGSATDEVDGRVLVEAAGPPGVLRTVCFGSGETDEGLDIVAPVVVEGMLTVIRHPARGEFPAIVELQVREARRVR
jgi:hypothetical protein